LILEFQRNKGPCIWSIVSKRKVFSHFFILRNVHLIGWLFWFQEFRGWGESESANQCKLVQVSRFVRAVRFFLFCAASSWWINQSCFLTCQGEPQFQPLCRSRLSLA
jgi:hypothetical protein